MISRSPLPKKSTSTLSCMCSRLMQPRMPMRARTLKDQAIPYSVHQPMGVRIPTRMRRRTRYFGARMPPLDDPLKRIISTVVEHDFFEQYKTKPSEPRK